MATMGLNAAALPDLYGSMYNWGNTTPTTPLLNSPSGAPNSGLGFTAGDMGSYGFQANGNTIATPGLTGGLGGAGSGGGGFGSGTFQWLKDNGWLTTKDSSGNTTQGMGGLALGAVQGLGSLYLGMQQYNLAKDQLAFSKEAFNKNYNAQRTSTNTQLEDRQRARVASNAGAYQSVGDYMATHGVK